MKSKVDMIQKYEAMLEKINHDLTEMEAHFLNCATPASLEEYRAFIDLKEQRIKVMADLDIAKSEPAETWEDSKVEFKLLINNLKKALQELMEATRFK